MLLRGLPLLLLALLVTTANTAAQVPDTIAAQRYAPLHVGNEWHFEDRRPPHYETNPPPPAEIWRYIQVEIVADTLIAGQLCAEVEVDSHWPDSGRSERATEFVRFDEEIGNVVSCTEDSTWMTFYYISPCPLDAPNGAFIEYCGSEWAAVEVTAYSGPLQVGDDEVEATVKEFIPMAMESTFTVASDIGVVNFASWYEEMRLIYARVDGIEYGSPMPVTAEVSPSALDPLELTVFPNPDSAIATAAFDLGQAQSVTLEVFDILGRQVREQRLGALPAGDHAVRQELKGLPAGLFIVHLSGDAGATATATFVRHRGE